MRTTIAVLRTWEPRRWLAAAVAAVAGAVVVAVPTDLIDTPLFSRAVPTTWWAWPALAASSLLGGLLTATYIRTPPAPATVDRVESTGAEIDDDRGRAWGGAGGVLTFFAVGCPVCNKIALLALGTSGALTWFAPVQPALALAAVGLLGWAFRRRLAGELGCPVPAPDAAVPGRVDP